MCTFRMTCWRYFWCFQNTLKIVYDLTSFVPEWFNCASSHWGVSPATTMSAPLGGGIPPGVVLARLGNPCHGTTQPFECHSVISLNFQSFHELTNTLHASLGIGFSLRESLYIRCRRRMLGLHYYWSTLLYLCVLPPHIRSLPSTRIGFCIARK